MKRIIAIFFMAIFAISASSSVYAMHCKCNQEDMGKCMEKHHDKMLDKMSKKLALTPEQKEKVAAVMKENGEKAKVEMQKMHEAMKAIQDEADKKIKELLTPEQIQKFDKMQEEQKAKSEKKMHHKCSK